MTVRKPPIALQESANPSPVLPSDVDESHWIISGTDFGDFKMFHVSIPLYRMAKSRASVIEALFRSHAPECANSNGQEDFGFTGE